jgi:hypothetical protein
MHISQPCLLWGAVVTGQHNCTVGRPSNNPLALLQILGVVVASGAADGLRSWLFQSAAERVMYHLRVHLFAALLQQEVGAWLVCVYSLFVRKEA